MHVRSEAVADQRVRAEGPKSRLRRIPVKGSQYRVLRAAVPRGTPRSVDRNCAGRNATSVKGLSPDKQLFPWWPSYYEDAKATPEATLVVAAGTTGVRDHGMYRRPAAERLRSARGRAATTGPGPRVEGQGVAAKFATIPRAEVRCLHSSDEAGQHPWSEGRHGE